jgi:deoxyribodipyrimidine photolyase-related protein
MATRDVLDLVARHFPDHFGDLAPFWFATTRAQAQAAFDHFLKPGCVILAAIRMRC